MAPELKLVPYFGLLYYVCAVLYAAEILGPDGSPYEKGVFQLEIEIPERPADDPKVTSTQDTDLAETEVAATQETESASHRRDSISSNDSFSDGSSSEEEEDRFRKDGDVGTGGEQEANPPSKRRRHT
ncbi:unnamed protein product [Phytophthora lilii]|uniref:Unnamed protein product n=1 Tax=Phytophthora lilii TaxID=2077276 RepID=A0A9W6WWX4_9STRA|nr:unnamed protein product [Phytophthora lilii]